MALLVVLGVGLAPPAPAVVMARTHPSKLERQAAAYNDEALAER